MWRSAIVSRYDLPMGGLYWVTPGQKERPPWARMPGESRNMQTRGEQKNHRGRCAASRTEARDYNNSVCVYVGVRLRKKIHAKKCAVVLFNSLHTFFPYIRNDTSGCGKSPLSPMLFHLLLIYL